MWSYRKHQIEGAEWALHTIRTKGLAYLAWQERTNKTGTALLTVENSKAKSALIVTKKKAIPGWEEHLANLPLTKHYVVINYESVHNIKRDFDFIILDESHHAISSIGKTSKTWKAIYKYTRGKAILYLSATPYAEHVGLIYHQLKLSKWCPFKHRNFYDWFRAYGVSELTRTPYGLVETYTKYKDKEVLDILKPYFNFKTRADVGIEHEPTVNVINIPMGGYNKKLIKQLQKDSVIEIEGHAPIICDSTMKLRMVHYQIEGGTIKTEDGYVTCGQEKIDYIKEHYEEEKIAVMAHFIAERKELSKRLSAKILILSSDGHAEGVDLSHIDKLIIYSMSFKTSKYTQRLARQANHSRATPIIVDILASNTPAIGYSIYQAVALKKENFDNNSYKRIWE